MQQCKDRLAILIREFLGVDILIEVLRLPGWRNDLNTAGERLACRYERRNRRMMSPAGDTREAGEGWLLFT